MKWFKNIAAILLILIGTTIIVACTMYNKQISAVDKDSKEKITVVIENGMTSKRIGKVLKNNGLIRNDDFFVLYLKLYKINDLKSSTYELSKSMDLKEIINVLQKGNSFNPDEITITFKEGIHIRKVASIIESNTNNSADRVFDVLKDEKYIDSLIEKYWFLTDEIKNKDLYYPLEGYLFPDTYNFKNKDVSVEEIFTVMLNKMNVEISKYKDVIDKSDFTVHEMISLATVIEKEVGDKEDYRQKVASVFYNRLDKKMSLGSDVTTYYAFKVDLSERELYSKEFNTYNPYNTRGPNMEGKLPVGPICAVGVSSLSASINPLETDYLFFVADKYGVTYFTKTNAEHVAKVNELKKNGDWFEYE